MTTLQDEIAAYEAMRAAVEADHLGKWVLVRGRELIGVFEDFTSVAAEAVKRFGRGPYLIRQVGAGAVSLPASLMLRPVDGRDQLRL